MKYIYTTLYEIYIYPKRIPTASISDFQMCHRLTSFTSLHTRFCRSLVSWLRKKQMETVKLVLYVAEINRKSFTALIGSQYRKNRLIKKTKRNVCGLC